MQISVLSARYRLQIPPVPGEQDSDTQDGSEIAATKDKAAMAFERGRDRAIKTLRRDTYKLLASIDFEPLLESWE